MKIFITGTIRTGGTILINALSLQKISSFLMKELTILDLYIINIKKLINTI